jgi:Fe-S oxidoreductase
MQNQANIIVKERQRYLRCCGGGGGIYDQLARWHLERARLICASTIDIDGA